MKWNLTKIIIAIGMLAIPVPIRLPAQDQPQPKKGLPASTAATGNYNFLIASGFLCDPNESTACPAVARAGDGETVEITGSGTLGVTNKSVTAYCDAITCHGFLRANNKDGTITTFDAPGDVNGIATSDINPAGEIAGYYLDASDVGHGFLRARDGTITTFVVPGANATDANSINPAGAITGWYYDASGLPHGFLRSP